MQRFIQLLADFVVARRMTAVSVVLIATAALCTQIPKMRSDPSPERLIRSAAGFDRRAGDDFRRRFGDSSRVLIFLVEADDVLSPAALGYQRRLALAFEDDPRVERVESLTTAPIPRVRSAAASDEVGLDELEAEGPSAEEPSRLRPELLNALTDLTAADPELFPGGVRALGDRLSNRFDSNPIFEGREVTAEQARDLVEALAHAPLLERRLYSADRKLAVVALWVKPLEARSMLRFVDELREHVADDPAPSGTRVRIAGLPYLRNTIVQNLRADQRTLIPLTILISALILWATLRWWFGVVMPLLVVACTVLMTVGGMALFDEPMNVMNNIIPSLLVIIGLSCAVHYIDRYLEEIGRGAEPKVAAKRSVQALTVATFLTAATTAAGFWANVFSRTVMLRSFGVIAGCGTMLSFLVALFLVPPTMISVRTPRHPKSEGAHYLLDVFALRVTRYLLRRPGPVMLASAMILIGSVVAATRVEIDHTLLGQFDPRDEVYQTTRILEDRLTGVRPLEVYLTSDRPGRFEDPEVLAALDRIRSWALEEHGPSGDRTVIDCIGPGQMLRQTLALLSGDERASSRPFTSDAEVHALATILSMRDPDPLSDWIRDGATRARLQLRLRDVGAKATLAFADELEARLRRELEPLGDVRFALTGEAYDGSIGQRVVVTDLVSSLGTSILGIFVLLVVLLRSVRHAAVAIPPNVLCLLGTLAYMVVRGIPLNTSTAIVFSVSLGLAVDGSILVIARFQEEVGRGLGPMAALARTARGTGRAILISQGSLVGGFAALLFSEFVPVRQFGELMAATVAVGLIGTFVLQPVLLLLYGAGKAETPAASLDARRDREPSSDLDDIESAEATRAAAGER